MWPEHIPLVLCRVHDVRGIIHSMNIAFDD